MTREIYIITRGNYSDYRIVGVWEDKAKAWAWVKEQNASREMFQSEMHIEVWPFEDDPEFAAFRNSTDQWRVEMSYWGNVIRSYIMTNPTSSPAELRARARSGWAPAGFFFSESVARDEEHAIKIAAEKWAVWKQKNEEMRVPRVKRREEDEKADDKRLGLDFKYAIVDDLPNALKEEE